MNTLLRASDALAAPCRAVARLCGWMLLLLMAVILYDVIGRRFYDTGSFKLQELEWHLHGTIAVLCFGWTYIGNAHVRIDIFTARIPQNAQLRLEIAAIVLLLIPFMAGLLWFGINFAHRAFVLNEGSPGGVGLSNRWIVKSMIPLGALLTLLGAVSVLLRCVVALRRPDLLASPWRN